MEDRSRHSMDICSGGIQGKAVDGDSRAAWEAKGDAGAAPALWHCHHIHSQHHFPCFFTDGEELLTLGTTKFWFGFISLLIFRGVLGNSLGWYGSAETLIKLKD